MDPRLLLVIVLITAEMALLTAVALFFSTFSSSALVSVVFTVGIFVAGLVSADLRRFADIVVVHPVVGGLVSAVGWALPAFSEFDIKGQIVHGLPVATGFIVYTLAYAVLYAGAVLLAAVGLFSSREFK